MKDYEATPLEHWSDDQLLRAAHAGNAAAFKTFVVRSVPHLWRYLRWLCSHYGLEKGLATDLAQETALRALTKVRACEEGRSALPKVTFDWLFAIAHNLVRDAYRKNKRGLAAFAVATEITKSRAPSREEQEQYEEIRELFNWLKDRDREVIQLVFLEGLTPEEAGSRMGLKAWASYKAFERAVRQLRDLVEQHGVILKRTRT